MTPPSPPPRIRFGKTAVRRTSSAQSSSSRLSSSISSRRLSFLAAVQASHPRRRDLSPSSADSGPNFINYKPICCWRAPLERTLPSAGICSAGNSARDGGMEGGENKDIRDSRHRRRHGAARGGTDGGGGVFFSFRGGGSSVLEKFAFFFSPTRTSDGAGLQRQDPKKSLIRFEELRR